MPLSKILLLAAHRDPESDDADAVPLNRDGPRYSDDIDILHDREDCAEFITGWRVGSTPTCTPEHA